MENNSILIVVLIIPFYSSRETEYYEKFSNNFSVFKF